VRKTIDEQKYAIDGMVGEGGNKAMRVAAGAFWLPFSILTGTAESPVSATWNAVKENDKPFSKSQFAISDCKTKTPEANATGNATPSLPGNATPSAPPQDSTP
jgi:hypothetical protein